MSHLCCLLRRVEAVRWPAPVLVVPALPIDGAVYPLRRRTPAGSGIIPSARVRCCGQPPEGHYKHVWNCHAD